MIPARRFRDLRVGDLAYAIDGDGTKTWAIVQKVVDVWTCPRCPIRGGLFATLSCWSDGSVMTFFRMWFRRSTGVEYANHDFAPPIGRPPVRLHLDLPKGLVAVARPKRRAQA